jgi:superfamily II DNA helicase RecQ
MRRQQSIQLALPGAAPASMTAQTPAVLGGATIPTVSPQVVLPAAADTATPEVTSISATTDEADLLERLRLQRTTLARAEAVPPYCVFTDRTLRDMAARRPADRTALLQIYGIGEAKVRKYGEVFRPDSCLWPSKRYQRSNHKQVPGDLV